MRTKSQKSTEEKMAIVMEGLKNETSISEICRNNHISQSLYYKWRDRFLEGGKQSLQSNSSQKLSEEYKSRVSELERVIGKKTIEIEILKKNLNLL
jgi:transposase-like protein